MPDKTPTFTDREVKAVREALRGWDRHQMNPYTEDALISAAAKVGVTIKPMYPELHGKDTSDAR